MSNKGTPPQPVLEPGLSSDENSLLNTVLPHDLDPDEMEQLWSSYQTVIDGLLIRLGNENAILDSMARAALVGTLEGIYARVALIPILSHSAVHAVRRHGLSDFWLRVGGECMLMELSAAAGYRTFCFPDLIKGLLKTGKMRDRSVQRMMDTFEFLNTMLQKPMSDPKVTAQLERTNGLHTRYKVAGAGNKDARDLFKYIALNMFYIGPMMRPDLTPQERHAICGLTVLVAKRMGHTIEGSVKDLEAFIAAYEAERMFDRDERSKLRERAVEIAQASKAALYRIPTISPWRVHAYVPHRVKQILQIV